MRKLLLLFFTCTVIVFAQAGFGSFSGTVMDPTKAVVPNAKVVISNETNGVKREISTNAAGIFQAPAVPPAAGYTVSVTAAGFNQLDTRDVLLQVGQNVDLVLTLQVAGTATEVQVNADAPLVDGTKTDVSGVVDSKQLLDLPINGRRFDSFVLLSPGVTNDGTFGLVSFRGMANGNSFLTDGNDTTNQYYQEAPGRSRIRSQISQDAVQEFQVITAAYMPEYGRASGGVVNTVTRSGSNDLHGTGFWFFRNRSLNARDRYATFNPPEVQHQYGFSLGGPIKKDKLFFFLNSEILRRHFPIATSYLRSGVIQNGHFVGCAAPATAAQCAAIDSILPRQYGQIDRSANSEIFFAKLDWHISPRNTLSANANYLRFLSPNGIQSGATYTNGSAAGNNGDSTVRVRHGRLSLTSVLTNSIFNEARFGFFKDRQFDDLDPALAPPFGNLTLTVNGATNLGVSSSYPRLLPSELRFNVADSVSWIQGKHSMKFGFDMNNTEDYTDQLFNRYGTYTYATVTNFALDFSDNPSGTKRWQTFSQGFGNSVIDFTVREWAFYAQDQFRVAPNLTLNYGIRYDYAQLPQPTVVNPDYPQTGRIPSFKGGIGPRIGLAYSLGSKTVLRAGWGLFQARYGNGILNTFFGSGNGVYSKSVSYTGSNSSDNAAGPIFPFRLDSTTKPASGTLNLTFASPDFRPPYSQNGDISVERQIGSKSSLTVSYLYNRGYQIVSVRDLNIGPLGSPVTYTILNSSGGTEGTYTTDTYRFGNRVDKKYAKINQVENGIRSWYDGLAVSYRGELVRGVQQWVAYTWSHAIDLGQALGDNNTNLFGSASLNSLYNGDYRQDKGNGQLDQRHRLVYTFVAQHDFTSSKSKVAQFALNGWQLSGILTLASGRPTYSTINIISKISDLTNFTLNGFGGDTRVPFWQVNPVLYDRTYKMDARLSKLFAFNERYKLTLNFEAFNVTNSPYNTGINHTAYDLTNTTLTPRSDFNQGAFSSGFPDGTNVRRAQVSARFVF